jgi:hypothetical protein
MTSQNAGFSVYDPALSDYATLLAGTAGDAKHAAGYVQSEFKMKPSEQGFTVHGIAVINPLGSRNADLQQAAHTALEHLADLLASSKHAMGAAASYYQSTDQANAEQADRAYPGHSRQTEPPAKPAGPYPGIRNVTDPELRTPVAGNPPVNPLAPIQQAQAMLSPADHILQIIKAVLGFDPLEKATEAFTGDWAKYSEIANGWSGLASFTDDINKNLTHGLAVLAEYWTGNAADAAQAYFHGLTKALGEMAGTFRALHTRYVIAENTTYDLAQDIASDIEAMVDTAIVMLLAASAVAQGGGDIPDDAVTGLAAALQGGKFLATLATALATITQIALLMAGLTNGLTAVTSYPLPHSAYQFPPK